ncbi:methionine ABC transporter ATP-binding protein [Oleisolibacter albus]|uniref:methionine ABC transporter ATP-binding protein n=1 Tax=Oleisolibacter albus TaxID=2171757 RepID=UPI000DF248C6|nr:ATP-binding cassette domain-containing protein [Oleisolibacter albus]
MEAQSRGAPAIRLDQIRKSYAAKGKGVAVPALDGIDLTVAAGSVTAIVGPSGAGKSSLLRCVNLLERPDSGRVHLGDLELTGLAPPALRQARRSIGMIFQHFNLLANRTVAGNVALALELAGWETARIGPRVAELLDLVGLADKADRYPSQLSGGQKQRVGIARALAPNPGVLLCDEATSALDPETTRQILELLARINRDLGLTVLLVTHEMAVVRQVADRVVVLESGRIIEDGPVEQVFARPQQPTTRTFLVDETGAVLPAEMAARLVSAPVPGGSTIVRFTAAGPAAAQPLLGRAAAQAGVDAMLLAGRVQPLRDQPFAAFVVELTGSAAAVDHALAAMTAAGAQIEVLGHVAPALRAAV